MRKLLEDFHSNLNSVIIKERERRYPFIALRTPPLCYLEKKTRNKWGEGVSAVFDAYFSLAYVEQRLEEPRRVNIRVK